MQVRRTVRLLLSQGIVNIPSRLGFGFIADRGFIAAIDLNTFAVGLYTAVVLAYFMFTTFISQLVFAAIFALGIGKLSFPSLVP